MVLPRPVMSMLHTPLPSVVSLLNCLMGAVQRSGVTSANTAPFSDDSDVPPLTVNVSVVADVLTELGSGTQRGGGRGCHVGARYRCDTVRPYQPNSRTIIVPLNVTESAGAVSRTTSDVLPWLTTWRASSGGM